MAKNEPHAQQPQRPQSQQQQPQQGKPKAPIPPAAQASTTSAPVAPSAAQTGGGDSWLDGNNAPNEQNPPLDTMTQPNQPPPVDRNGAPPTHSDDPLITPEEVARRIGKTGPTVRQWIKDGLLKAIRQPSGLFMIRTSEVNKLLGASALQTTVSKCTDTGVV